jgi:hypothetical protein
MSPSRGPPIIEASTETSTEIKADMRSSSALAAAKQNISFLYSPSSGSNAPARLRTRALLRSLHYIGVFIFWRIVRYAKYALVGSVIAAVGSTAIGSGVAFFVAPPTLFASVGVGLIWAVGKWGFRKMGVGERVAEGVVRSHDDTRRDGSWGGEQGPMAVPW